MHRKIGVVCAFMEEEPSHSPYSVHGLLNTLSCITDLEFLAVANGAEVAEETRKLFEKTPHSILLELPENIGVSAAWNLGIEQLDCDHLFILNDDLWLNASVIMELVRVLKEKPDTAVVGVEGGECTELDSNGYPVATKKYEKGKKQGFFNTSRKWSGGAIEVSVVSGLLFGLSMEFVKKTGFRFDTRYTPAFCEEMDLAFFARANGYKARILLGLDAQYEHICGISAEPVEIKYLDKTIMSDELSERNMGLFAEKWKERAEELMTP
jgi:GT2 family glycosyltransferase